MEKCGVSVRVAANDEKNEDRQYFAMKKLRNGSYLCENQEGVRTQHYFGIGTQTALPPPTETTVPRI